LVKLGPERSFLRGGTLLAPVVCTFRVTFIFFILCLLVVSIFDRRGIHACFGMFQHEGAFGRMTRICACWVGRDIDNCVTTFDWPLTIVHRSTQARAINNCRNHATQNNYGQWLVRNLSQPGATWCHLVPPVASSMQSGARRSGLRTPQRVRICECSGRQRKHALQVHPPAGHSRLGTLH
jgi:hypothetical protein